jgi:hypothetical protein
MPASASCPASTTAPDTGVRDSGCSPKPLTPGARSWRPVTVMVCVVAAGAWACASAAAAGTRPSTTPSTRPSTTPGSG